MRCDAKTKIIYITQPHHCTFLCLVCLRFPGEHTKKVQRWVGQVAADGHRGPRRVCQEGRRCGVRLPDSKPHSRRPRLPHAHRWGEAQGPGASLVGNMSIEMLLLYHPLSFLFLVSCLRVRTCVLFCFVLTRWFCHGPLKPAMIVGTYTVVVAAALFVGFVRATCF